MQNLLINVIMNRNDLNGRTVEDTKMEWETVVAYDSPQFALEDDKCWSES